jgi:hypothetical protein
MNTTASPNPFSGLKASLARILSGGWMGLVLHVLFARRINAALTALEDLFAQWKAGTLASPAIALASPAVALAVGIPARVRTTAPARAAGRQAAVPAAPHALRSRPAARRRLVAQAAAPRVARFHAAGVPDRLAPALDGPRPSRRRARCTKRIEGKAPWSSPNLFRFHNK